MLSIHSPAGSPAGPATTAGAARRAGDNGALPEGFEGLLAGLLAPPAPPQGTLPAVDLAAARAAPSPMADGDAVPSNAVPSNAVSGDAVPGEVGPGDAEPAPQGGRPGQSFRPGLTMPPTAGEPAVPAAATAAQGQVATAPEPGPAKTIPAAAATRTEAGDAVPAGPATRGEDAPAGAPPAARPGAERAVPRAAVGAAVIRSTSRADAIPAMATTGAVDALGSAEDGLAWRGLLALDGTPAFDRPLDAAGTTEPPLAASAVRQLALAIGRAVSGDVRQLSVQLSPEELGSLEITVDFADERRVAVTILAERPETLDMLRGETRQLERLLAQQGVSLAGGSFELGLMADGRGQRREHADAGSGQRASIDLADQGDVAPPAAAAAPPVRRGLLNLSV